MNITLATLAKRYKYMRAVVQKVKSDNSADVYQETYYKLIEYGLVAGAHIFAVRYSSLFGSGMIAISIDYNSTFAIPYNTADLILVHLSPDNYRYSSS